jgi:transcriptional regulator with XRE-family HTH domain
MNEKKLPVNNERRERLRIARESLSMSQRTLAEKCDMKAADIKNRENGVVEVKQIFADGLEKKTGIRSDWLMHGQGPMKAPIPDQSVVCPPGADPYALGKAGVVLNSGTIYGEALKQNIEAFYQAVQKEVRSEETPRKMLGDTG